jgi:SET domain-containing protein
LQRWLSGFDDIFFFGGNHKKKKTGRDMSFQYQSGDNAFVCNLDCRQCEAQTKKAAQCQRTTCKSLPYCAQHLRSELKVYVAPSGIAGAGDGLFTLVSRKRGDFLAPYVGRVINRAQMDEMYGEDNLAPYTVQISRDLLIDAACARGIGAMANHALPANAKFVTNARTKTVKVVATRALAPNQEIFVDYGNEYFIESDDSRFSTSRRKVKHPSVFAEQFVEPARKQRKMAYPQIHEYKTALYAAPSRISGRGLFSSVPIAKGQIITCIHDPMEIEGDVNANWPEDAVLHISAKNIDDARKRDMVIFDGSWNVPEEPPMWYFQNHSASPNSEMKLYAAGDKATVCFVAKKNIAANEEIVFNYQPGKTLRF